MKRILLAALVSAAGLVGIAGSAQATPVAPLDGLAGAPIEKAQVYTFGGRRYCYYPNGWQGPGFYWCGYAWRYGYGWGGPVGWRGWYYPGYRRPVYRPPGYRPVYPGYRPPAVRPYPGGVHRPRF